ncbi:hypothetical protein LINPERHAP1_LOCUS7822 [Linum perenne]
MDLSTELRTRRQLVVLFVTTKEDLSRPLLLNWGSVPSSGRRFGLWSKGWCWPGIVELESLVFSLTRQSQ